MSIFSNPAANFSTAPFLLETGEYDLKISGIKAKTIDKNDGSQGGIISFQFRVVGGEHDNRMVQSLDCWYDDEGTNNQAMKVVMAALGVRPGTEAGDAEFKSLYPDLDLGFSGNDLTPNAGWQNVLNAVISVSVTKSWNQKREGNENKYKNYRPFGK